MACDGTTDGRTETDPVSLMTDLARREMLSTFGPRVMKLSGAFAGLFRLDYNERIFQRHYRNPVLVAACHSARGGRVDLALRTDRLKDLAIDAVSASANDMLTVGAEPLFLLHHLAGALEPASQLQVIEGLAEGCRQAGCALLSGEKITPASSSGPIDLAIFAVGVCDHKRMITGERIEPDDEVIGIASAGLHGQAYDLAGRLLLEQRRPSSDTHVDELSTSVTDTLLQPAVSYATPVLRILRYYRRKRVILGMAHIREGGMADCLLPILPEDRLVQIDAKAWPLPPVYSFFLEQGGVSTDQLWQTCNMGLGYVMIVRPTFTQSILKQLRRRKMQCWRIGHVTKGARHVNIER